MRKFYLLTISAKECYDVLVAEYELLDENGAVRFDSMRMLQCERLPDDYFAHVMFRLNRRKPCDYVHLWQIVSPRFLAIFEQFAHNDIQVMKVPIVDSADRPVLTDFRLVNVLRCLEESVDLALSNTSPSQYAACGVNIIDFVFRTEKVPPHIHLFRPRESMSRLVVSEEFVRATRAAKLTGHAFVKTASV